MSVPAIDAFVMLGQSVPEPLARLDSANVEQAIVSPVKPLGYHLAPANDLVADAVAREPRLFGLGRVDPNQGDAAVRELERCRQDLGLCGLFLHPWEECFRVNEPRFEPLFAQCADLHMPVLIATGYPWVSEAAQVGDVARRHPGLVIVMTHGGQLNISGLGQADAMEVLRRYPNVAMETSGVYRQDFLEDVARELGPERVLFGSNSPRMDVRLEIERVRWAALDADALELLLAGNASRIFRPGASVPRG